MKEDKPTLDSLSDLRRRAEAALSERSADVQALSVEETRRLIHELQVYQIELEAQNEELRRVQQELAAACDKYADLYDFAPVGYFAFGENGLILEANLTGADLLGVERGSLLGNPLSRFIARADQDVYYRHRRQVLATKDRQTCKIEMVKSDGTEFYAQMESACLVDSDGTVTKHRTVISDITRRKRAEKALREREEELQLILASTGEGIFGVDLDCKCTFANRASVALLGYQDQSDLLGQHMHVLMRHSRPDGTPYPVEDCHVCQAYRQGKSTNQDHVVFWRPDGSSFPAECRSYPQLRDGRVIGTVVSFTDITERKEKEAQLLQAQKMEVVGRLTGGIAHDFNNLLTVILGNLQLLEEDLGRDADEERRELVDDALSAALDGAKTIRRLLAFSRRQPLQPRRLDINDILNSLQRFLRRTLGEDVELRIHRTEDVMAVFADPSKLENALLNLAINARDAMPKGGTLSIEITRKDIDLDEAADYPELAPGSYVMVCVSDTGVGMPPEEAGRAVEPFYTTKEDGKGSGFGLSMAYGFAKQSYGDLLLTSEPGMGTTVSMLLPEAAPGVDEGGVEATPRALPRGAETILVVEDERRVRKLTRRSLTSLGYHVLEAENAVEAITILLSEPAVDLLFSDIVMPGAMNGRELARWALANCPGLKVLLTTGFSEAMESEPSVDHGGFPLLKKPYTKERLAQAIWAALDTQTH